MKQSQTEKQSRRWPFRVRHSDFANQLARGARAAFARKDFATWRRLCQQHDQVVLTQRSLAR